MEQKHTTWHGAELSPVAIKAGFVDYFAAAEAVDAEYYDINAEDEGTWELVNGDELYFRDSDGEGYSSEMAMERVRELEAMIAGAEEDQDTSRSRVSITRCQRKGQGYCWMNPRNWSITTPGWRSMYGESVTLG